MAQNPYQPTQTTGFQSQNQLRKQRSLYVIAWIVCYATFTFVFVIGVFLERSFIAVNEEYFIAGLIVFCLFISIAAPGEAWSRIAPFFGFLICILGHFLVFGVVSAFFALVFGELPVAS